ncbi:MAG: hypothetical protein M5U09_21215 [Gammaproteobacteria bacterium]|nr:hypothetical protein [Gammaproteobacteria bacterium]
MSDNFLLRLLLHGGVPSKDLTETMMRAVVERADEGEQLPPEVQYFVEPFRAYLNGKSIKAALHLDKRNKKIDAANRDFRIAATFEYFRHCENLGYEDALTAASNVAKKSSKTVEEAWRQYRNAIQAAFAMLEPDITYSEYLRAASGLEKDDEKK